MEIRPLRPSDFEPLHALYLSQLVLMPHQQKVGIDAFTAGLTTTRYQEDEHWNPEAHRALVAEHAGRPVAFAFASCLTQDARYSRWKAGTGLIRFLFAAPEATDALRTLLRILIEEAKAHACTDLRALDGYGPLFHNCGLNMLSNAWPWVGRALVQEGFETYGSPTLAMYCPLDRRPIVRLPLPSGAELRYDWVTRIGERDAAEGGYHLFFGEDRAAESMWHLGEKYVPGSGNTLAHLFWLGTNAPHRGKGLGRLLLRESLARVQEQGARGSDLRCNINNFYAHSLYRAEGYEPNDLLWAFQYSPQRLSQ